MLKRILAESDGGECEVDVEILHKTLLELPAEKYLDLHRKMFEKIYGYQPFVSLNNCSGFCKVDEDDMEDNIGE